MDEGWTRWIFEQWDIPYQSLEDEAIRTGDLQRYDAIVIPDMSPRSINEGLSGDVYPAQYAGGIGSKGQEALRNIHVGVLGLAANVAIAVLGSARRS